MIAAIFNLRIANCTQRGHGLQRGHPHPPEVIRIAAQKIMFLFARDWNWNMFDLLVVGMAVVERVRLIWLS